MIQYFHIYANMRIFISIAIIDEIFAFINDTVETPVCIALLRVVRQVEVKSVVSFLMSSGDV